MENLLLTTVAPCCTPKLFAVCGSSKISGNADAYKKMFVNALMGGFLGGDWRLRQETLVLGHCLGGRSSFR